MPNIEDCIAAAVTDGKITARGAEEYSARMKDQEALAAQRGMGPNEANIFAVTEAAMAMEKRATSTRAITQKTILAIDRVWEDANRHQNGLFRGLETALGQNVRAGGTAASIEARRMALIGSMQSRLSDLMVGLQSKAFGLSQNTILPKHTVSALFGKDVPDPAAKAAAAAWTKNSEWWVDRMREAGVPIGKMEDWRLPQHFDALAVKALRKEGFVAKMDAWWREGGLAMRNWEDAGEANLRPGVAADEAKARKILEGAYTNITTNGGATIEPGATRSTTLADRYGRRRVFEWTSDDAWMAFNRDLGVGDDAIGELMVRHIDTMARDLSLAQTLGPDPNRAAQVLGEMAAVAGLAPRRLKSLERIYWHTSGQASTPVNAAAAAGFQAVRSGLGAAQLGGAILSAPTDFAFTKATASWNGLSMTRIMQNYVSDLIPGDPAHQKIAMRRALILENGLRGLHDAARDTIADTMARKGTGASTETFLSGAARIAGRAVEVVLRAQGLAHHTQILRDAIGMEFQAHWFDISGKTFAELDGVDRRTMTRYGITSGEWDVLRTQGKTPEGFLDPAALSRGDDAVAREAGLKFLGAIAIEQRIGVPEGNAITRAMTTGKTQAGTVDGELLRSLMQYKGFPLGAGLMHGWRMIESLMDSQGQIFRGQYIASLTIMTTALGAVALQLKNIASGRDPEPMFDKDNPFFWAKAAAQGGAGGIIGDQVKALVQTKSSGDAARLMSPVGGLALDLGAFLGGNVNQALSGDKTNIGREAVNLGRKYNPEVFYLRTMIDRLVWDTLQKWADPEASSVFNRIEQRARKEQDTEYWWRPGQIAPSRAPDATRVGVRQ